MSSSTPSISTAQAFVDGFNADYERKHLAFEEQFWGTKMALQGGYSAELLSQTKADMEDLLSDPSIKQQAEDLRKNLPDDAPEDLKKTLDIIIRTCDCYQMPTDAKELRQECSKVESDLVMKRNQMKLGYTVNGVFHPASSVALRNLLRTSPDEAVRMACYEGLKSIGPFVLHNGFVEIIKLRNRMAKSLGYSDYYEYKLINAEGFGKDRLFEILDKLEEGTRPNMIKARQELQARYGEDAVEPWNMSYKMAGSVVVKLDPYFPFGKSVERYVRSYAALKISYLGSTMNLDLLDRQNKYSNGFCHWPKPAWRKPDGTWQPAVTNFTSLADPSAVGSGLTALKTLMHEAGHAAHFANIQQPSPLFSQERAPTSVAYAETQSMFLDSLVSDAAWRAKYARNADGDVLPFVIIQEEVEATHPFAVFALRAMLAVSYFEKALYELPEEKVTAEHVLALADNMELKIQGGFSPRPLLSVPHLISDEASCYYHGYTLAQMSVYQTRAFFLERDGFIVDNPKVGPTLREVYWECGNSRNFLDLVQDLTRKELSGDAWIAELEEDVEEKVKREKKEYDEALAKAASSSDEPSTMTVDLDMTVKFVDGDELIADSSQFSGGILEACKTFEAYVAARTAAAET